MRWIARQLGKYREAVVMAFEAIKANKLRSALTVLGVLIGVTTVVAMMSIIEGLNLSIERDSSFLSGPTFEVQTHPIMRSNFDDDNPNFTIDDAKAIMEQCPNVALADIESFNTAICEYRGNKTRPITITSASTGYFDTLNEQYVGEGRIINQNDVNTARDVIVIGPDVAATLFGTLDPVGRRIKVNGRSFTVVGVFDTKGEVFGTSWDNYVVIPETTFTKIFGKNKDDSIIFIRAIDTASLDLAMDEAEALLRRRRGVKPEDDNNFYILTAEQLLQIWGQITGGAFAAMIAIAGISLLVGGIGIMNIMLVAVTERTREIGIRKALGARRRDIMKQFVTEAVVVSLVGGVAGVILGVLIANLVGWTTPLIAATSTPSLFLGFFFSISVGLFFGIYPAWKASKLDPIESLRYE